jgi:hypothetical protein
MDVGSPSFLILIMLDSLSYIWVHTVLSETSQTLTDKYHNIRILVEYKKMILRKSQVNGGQQV